MDPESWRSVGQFKDDHAFEEFEDKSEFNDDQVGLESWRPVEQFKDNHAFEEFENESEFNDNHAFEEFGNKNKIYYQSEVWLGSSNTNLGSQAADQVRKLGLNFTYYKSEVAGRWSGPKIGTDLHLLQVWSLRLLIRSGNWERSSSTSPRSQADQVRKLGMIFTYYKSEVSGWSGTEIQTRPNPRTVRISQLHKAKS